MARAAYSLDVLLDQLNAAFPKRSKRSDGGIGDPAHQARVSDHNPVNGVFHARDYTHDPGNGLDIAKLADQLAASRDPRIKYIIANKLFWEPRVPRWVRYTGANPHTGHLHLSVLPGVGDDRSPWALPMLGGATPVRPAPAIGSVLRPGSTGPRVRALQRVLNAWYPREIKLALDSVYGPATEAAVRIAQRNLGVTVDGLAGPTTLGRLGLK